MDRKMFILSKSILYLFLISTIMLNLSSTYSSNLDISEEKICVSYRQEIKEVYKIFKSTNDKLTLESFMNNSEEYFDQSLRCPSGGTYSILNGEILCSIHKHVNDNITLFTEKKVTHNFSSDNFQLTQMSNLITNKSSDDWEIIERNGLKTLSNKKKGHNKIFLENNYSQYSISSTLTLGGDILKSDGSTKEGRGYGISFETTTDKKGKDTGYMFQFDPGYEGGKFLIRKRLKGKESDPFLVIEPSEIIPEFTNIFWVDSHDITITVTNNNINKKHVRVFIDGIEVTYGNNVFIDALDDRTQNYVGIRTWNKSKVFVESLEYIPLQ